MAKNTGRGSRVASPDYVSDKPETMWTRRDNSAGKFQEAKSHGGTFKGIDREGARRRAAAAKRRYQLKQARENVLLFPFKALLIGLNVVLVPVMVLVGFAMLLLTPLFILVALLRPFVLAGGLITLIFGVINLALGTSGAWIPTVIGAVLVWLALTVKVKFTTK